MKFPILIKKKRVFLWRGNKWLNVSLSAQAHGYGIKGYYRFFVGLFHCLAGRHKYIHVFRMKDLKTHKECSYCGKENEKSSLV